MEIEALNKGKNPSSEVREIQIGGKPTLIIDDGAMISHIRHQQDKARQQIGHRIGIHDQRSYWPEPTQPKNNPDNGGGNGERTISMTYVCV